jgi:hypothetical protein
MSALKTAALAAAVLGGTLAAAQAQPYGHYGHGHAFGHGHGYGRYYRPQPPVYVHPRIARKQAQLQERFVERYGYVQPRGYHQPGPYWGHAHPRPRPPVTFHYGW